MGRWESYPFGGAFVLSLFAFFTPAPDLPSGPDVSDKLEHAAIFTVLALTGRLAGIRPFALLVGLVGYAVASEVLQAVLPIHRDGDWHDAVADSGGVLIGLAVVAALSLVGRRMRPGAGVCDEDRAGR